MGEKLRAESGMVWVPSVSTLSLRPGPAFRYVLDPVKCGSSRHGTFHTTRNKVETDEAR